MTGNPAKDIEKTTWLHLLAQRGRLALLAGRVALGGIFMYAAYSKLHIAGRWHLGDYQILFAMTIHSYQMSLPTWLELWTARIVPWLELFLGALLIFGVGDVQAPQSPRYWSSLWCCWRVLRSWVWKSTVGVLVPAT